MEDWVDMSISETMTSGLTQMLDNTETTGVTLQSDIKPLFAPIKDDDYDIPEEVHEALRLFGHESFRPGQKKAIMRILSGQSTLLILSTGSGKSLCYQLPAYLYAKHYNCISICVSPLVSLMEDQVTGLPGFLNAVCLHTNQNATQRERALTALRNGAQILLVSPEAIVASKRGGVLGTLLKELPPIAFVCLDEVHCVSEWSHNFRPSYLRVCQVLREQLNVNIMLGLTATAKYDTALSISKHLKIPDHELGIISGVNLPENLKLSVSRDENREEALINILKGDRFSDCDSIIIYCTRRNECERVAGLIRMQLMTASKIDVKQNLKRGRSLCVDAEAYHAGLSNYRRQQVQKWFMSGKLRIVVATVAFGMGIDKSDVRGIIHFNMPRNLESYVQEIGRAGRDGKISHCHLFLDANDGKDIQELKRHIYANSVDRHTVRKLLDRIFPKCLFKEVDSLENQSFGVHYHDNAIPIDPLISALDIPEENIQTLLCYIELLPEKYIKIKSHTYSTCRVVCYSGPKQLCAVSKKCPPLAVALALERKNGINLEDKNSITFPVVSLSSRMNWSSGTVKKDLKSLEWTMNNGRYVKSGVTIEFSDLSFCLEHKCGLSDDEYDQILDILYSRCQSQEKSLLKQLQFTYKVLREASHGTVLFCCDEIDDERSKKLRNVISDYFKEGSTCLDSVDLQEQIYIRPDLENRVGTDVLLFIQTHQDHQWTGRAVARIFHGIGSPNFPIDMWCRVRRFWRCHLNVSFNIVVNIATKVIIKYKM